jgi:hypothetical protein
MSRATGYISDADIGASTYSIHWIGLAYMDSISVGAIVRGKYTNIFGLDVLGQNDGYGNPWD